MELESQEMRKLSAGAGSAPDRNRLEERGSWASHRSSIESTFGDSHPGSGHLDILVEEVRKGVACRQADTEQDTLQPISVTVRAREQTASISVWQAVR